MNNNLKKKDAKSAKTKNCRAHLEIAKTIGRIKHFDNDIVMLLMNNASWNAFLNFDTHAFAK